MSGRKKKGSSSSSKKKKKEESEEEEESSRSSSSSSSSKTTSKKATRTKTKKSKTKESKAKDSATPQKDAFDIESVVASVRGGASSKSGTTNWFDPSAIVPQSAPKTNAEDKTQSSSFAPASSSSSSSVNSNNHVARSELSLTELVEARNRIREITILLIVPILEAFVHEQVLCRGKNSSDYTIIQCIESRSQEMLTYEPPRKREFFVKCVLKRFEKLIWYLDVWLIFEVMIWMVSKWKWFPIDSRFIPSSRMLGQKQLLVYTGIKPEHFADDLVKYLAQVTNRYRPTTAHVLSKPRLRLRGWPDTNSVVLAYADGSSLASANMDSGNCGIVHLFTTMQSCGLADSCILFGFR